MALNGFEGTVMLVSHDRALLREVCDEFWLVTKGGVSEFDGDLDDYQKWLLEQSRLQAAEMKAAAKQAAAAPAPAPVAAPVAAPVTAAAPSPVASSGNRKEERKAQAEANQKLAAQTKPIKQELAKVEQRLAAASEERDRIGEALAGPALSATERVDLGRKLKELGDEIDALEAKWLNLSESLQLLQQG
jgi:ATP-binding cassette subfamily F protein 3